MTTEFLCLAHTVLVSRQLLQEHHFPASRSVPTSESSLCQPPKKKFGFSAWGLKSTIGHADFTTTLQWLELMPEAVGYLWLSNNSNIWALPGRTWRWLGTYDSLTTATSGPYLEELEDDWVSTISNNSGSWTLPGRAWRWLGIYESQTTARAGPYLEELEDDAPIGSHHFQQHVKLRAVSSLTVGCAQCERQEIQHGWYHQSTRFMNLGEINGKYTRSVLICLSVIWIFPFTP